MVDKGKNKKEVKILDEMNVEELKQYRNVLRNEEYDSEYQYEFTKLEIREIDKLIEIKTLQVKIENRGTLRI